MRADAARRREKIIEAAGKLFVAQGQKVKLEQVAAEAGVGIATLYRNFPTRDALIHQCIVNLCDEVCARGKAAAAALGEENEIPADVLATLVEETIPVGINVLIPALIEPDEDQLSETLVEKKYQVRSSLAEIMAAARERGFIHESVTDEWVLRGLIHLYHPATHNGDGSTTAEDIRPLIAIFLEGCEKGVLGSFWYGDPESVQEN